MYPEIGPSLGKILIAIGAFVFVLGVILLFSDRIPLRIGRLPGDVVYRRGNFTFYFPIVTSLLLSVLLTLVFWLFGRR